MKLDPKTTAFIFPGQGSQAVGMGRDLAAEYSVAKSIFDEANDILGFNFSKILWDGPKEELDETINTQPALFTHSLAAFKVFRHQFPDFKPATVAGHSLGELSALAAAEALSFADGLRLVRKRGELMKRAGELNPGRMAAILGLDIPSLEKVCAEASAPNEIVQVANDNCPGQVVISGAKTAVDRAIEGAKAAGAKRGIPLAVSIAAHSPLMDSIQVDWNAVVDACEMRDPSIPVVGNVHANALTTAESLRDDLKAQMQSRVRWTESVRTMLGMGTQAFVEVGSGEVLLGMVKRIQSDVARYPFGTPSDFSNLVS